MFVREDATDRDEDDESEHGEIEEDLDRFIFNIIGKENGGAEEDRGDDHDVGGREGRLAGAVWAGV